MFSIICPNVAALVSFINFFNFQKIMSNLKIAIIGQSQFGEEVYKLLRKDGHEIVGVFTIPDVKGRADPLGTVHVLRLVTIFVLLAFCSEIPEMIYQ